MSKYLPYLEAKKYIAKFRFKTLSSYRQYIKSNGINFLPLDPNNRYWGKGYRTSEFLGLSEETYKQNLKELRIMVSARMRTFITAETHKKRAETKKAKSKVVHVANASTVPAPKPVLLNGLDPDKVIQFLISEDVAPETIVKMVAEMDIKSSTLMNDLCKYMQARSNRQQATWRPTGYNTSEAQMSLKV